VFCGVPAMGAQLLVSNNPFGVVGASGVIYGLFGFLWVMSRRRDDAAEVVTPHLVQTMLAWLVICFLVNMFGGSIGNTAHAVGLAFGWVAGQVFVARKRYRLPIAAGALAGWVLVLGLTYRPVWERTLAHLPLFGGWYMNDVGAAERAIYEDPENAPEVGLFSTRRR
jgi:hypothetical protein